MTPIRPCTPGDLPKIHHLQPEGWEDITPWFRFYCNHSFCYPVVVEHNQSIIGIGTAISNGNSGWVAQIVVDHNHRGKGIGYEITGHLIKSLRSTGAGTIHLIATEMGFPLYKKMGFQTITEYAFFRGTLKKGYHPHYNIRPFQITDLSRITDLDQSMSGENRMQMLDKFSANILVFEKNKEITGYFYQDFGEGMIIATNKEAGIELLKMKLQSGKIKTVIPVENKHCITFLKKIGFEHYNSAKRMILGENFKWKPECIYSRAGGYYA
jgi:N-acetylglutamate synthase-like GNAT family acetyltransferase